MHHYAPRSMHHCWHPWLPSLTTVSPLSLVILPHDWWLTAWSIVTSNHLGWPFTVIGAFNLVESLEARDQLFNSASCDARHEDSPIATIPKAFPKVVENWMGKSYHFVEGNYSISNLLGKLSKFEKLPLEVTTMYPPCTHKPPRLQSFVGSSRQESLWTADWPGTGNVGVQPWNQRR